MNKKQIIMPVHTKVKSIYLLTAAVIVNFRIFQLLDFPKTLKKNIVQTMNKVLTDYFMHFK